MRMWADVIYKSSVMLEECIGESFDVRGVRAAYEVGWNE